VWAPGSLKRKGKGGREEGSEREREKERKEGRKEAKKKERIYEYGKRRRKGERLGKVSVTMQSTLHI
jgi:hypothetical protein